MNMMKLHEYVDTNTANANWKIEKCDHIAMETAMMA